MNDRDMGGRRHDMARQDWTGWKAIIHPTDVGDTYGISWEDAPAMAARGGYSGPYRSRDDAEEGVRAWQTFWGMTDDDITIEHRESAR